MWAGIAAGSMLRLVRVNLQGLEKLDDAVLILLRQREEGIARIA